MENKEKTYFGLLKKTCKAINSGLKLAECLNLITENMITILNVKACAVFLWNRERNKLQVIACNGLSESYLKKGPVDADKSITETLAGGSAMIWDTGNDPRIEYPDEAKKEGIASILSVPIPVKGRIIGALRIYTSERRNFSKDPYEFITCVADLIGIAVDNSQIYDHLKADRDNRVDKERK